jgi:membrane protease YdiL (CAAX protease family)
MIGNSSLSIGKRIDGVREMGKVGIVLDLLMVFAPLVVMGVIGEFLGDDTALGVVLINLAYVASVVIATFVLRSRGSGWREIGMAKPASWRKTVLLGVGTLIAYLFISIVFQALLVNVLGLAVAPSDRSSFDVLYGNLPLLILYVAAAWTFIAFGEEMIFRAFLMNTLAQLFDSAKARWVLTLIGSSIIFGLAHFSWGVMGIVETTLMGLVLGFVYLRSGRNLWITIIAHGIANTLGFTMVYLGAG